MQGWDESTIVGNRSKGAAWRHFGAAGCHHSFNSARSCYIAGNTASRGESKIPAVGILMMGTVADTPSQSNVIADNPCRDLLDDDVAFYGRSISGCRVTGTASVRYADGAPAQLVTGPGKGSPEGVLSAVVGSQYKRLDSVPGATFYVKETGAGNTGWVAK